MVMRLDPTGLKDLIVKRTRKTWDCTTAVENDVLFATKRVQQHPHQDGEVEDWDALHNKPCRGPAGLANPHFMYDSKADTELEGFCCDGYKNDALASKNMCLNRFKSLKPTKIKDQPFETHHFSLYPLQINNEAIQRTLCRCHHLWRQSGKRQLGRGLLQSANLHFLLIHYILTR